MCPFWMTGSSSGYYVPCSYARLSGQLAAAPQISRLPRPRIGDYIRPKMDSASKSRIVTVTRVFLGPEFPNSWHRLRQLIKVEERALVYYRCWIFSNVSPWSSNLSEFLRRQPKKLIDNGSRNQGAFRCPLQLRGYAGRGCASSVARQCHFQRLTEILVRRGRKSHQRLCSENLLFVALMRTS